MAAKGNSNLDRAPVTPAAVSVLIEGKHLVFRTDDSRAIYTYDKDPAGQSACTGACAVAWLPIAAPANVQPVGDWTVITRTDGAKQWAYKGKAVYAFAKDVAGEAKGDGMDGAWHVLNP